MAPLHVRSQMKGAKLRLSLSLSLVYSDRFRTSVLRQYMSHFDFTGERIDASFRKLCAKLYFKAEAQQIDRILEAFANRYHECNPKSILKNAGLFLVKPLKNVPK